MVIDEELNPPQSIEEACRTWGHEVFSFKIPFEAVEAIDSVKPEVIFVRTQDHPFELIRTIHKNAIGVPLIYVTDLLLSEEGEKGLNAMRAGAYGFILTPAKATEFRSTIDLALDYVKYVAADVSSDSATHNASPDDAAVAPPPADALTDEQKARLERASCMGKYVTFKVKGKPGNWQRIGIVEDEVYIIIGEYKHLIQRIKFENESWDKSEYAYRTGYYTYQADRKAIKWGQYTQFVTEKEYRKLLAQARAKGWDIF